MRSAPATALDTLKGQRLLQVGRAAELLWLHFGNWNTVTTKTGRLRQVGDWALHVQVPWRFMRNLEIVLGTMDFYVHEQTGEDLADAGEIGESRFDRRSAVLNRCLFHRTTFVDGVSSDHVGGFRISFDRRLQFDVFPNVSLTQPDVEFWRLFRPGHDTDHIIAGTD